MQSLNSKSIFFFFVFFSCDSSSLPKTGVVLCTTSTIILVWEGAKNIPRGGHHVDFLLRFFLFSEIQKLKLYPSNHTATTALGGLITGMFSVFLKNQN